MDLRHCFEVAGRFRWAKVVSCQFDPVVRSNVTLARIERKHTDSVGSEAVYPSGLVNPRDRGFNCRDLNPQKQMWMSEPAYCILPCKFKKLHNGQRKNN